jgi:transposase-like protein
VDRRTGRAKSIVVADVTKATLLPILRENIAKEATVYTDEAKQYSKLGQDFADHDFTTHSKGEYGRGVVHTNTVEGYFSVFKRGMKGVYQHCAKKHLHRYAAEFDFRYNHRAANSINDAKRASVALSCVTGRRLLYRDVGRVESAPEAQHMIDAISYTFKIDDFTPESMPFGRLVEYYAEIKKMLGVADNLHLVGVFKSSHGSAFAIDRNFETQLVKRLIAINEGTAPKTAIRAQSTINSMLREDGTSGAFFDKQNHNVVQFPGKRSDDSAVYRTRDAASFTGELYHISGSKDDVKARVNTDAYGVVFCTTTREIGRMLRDFLFEDVKVSGRGTWSRSPHGK